MKSNRSMLPDVILLSIGAIFLLAFGAMYGTAKLRQAKCTAETSAAITAVESREVRKNQGSGKYVSTHLVTVYYPVYSFTADGSYYAPGRQVTVHYQPDDPGNNYIVPVGWKKYAATLRIAMVLLALGVLRMTSRLRRNK